MAENDGLDGHENRNEQGWRNIGPMLDDEKEFSAEVGRRESGYPLPPDFEAVWDNAKTLVLLLKTMALKQVRFGLIFTREV